MTGKQAGRFLAERVEAMAIMHLTRRDDLVVRREIREKSEPIMDLMVEIREAGRPMNWKRFGVYLQGVTTPGTIEAANSKLKISLRRFFNDYGEPSLPFCVFYFTMEDDQGYYTWLAEPLVEAGRPHLQYHPEKADCRPLDLGSIDSMVAAVNAYYAALKKTAIVASGHSPFVERD